MFKQLLLISSLLYAVYSWYRRFRARSTLVDGPYPPSWLYGHLDEIKGLNGVGFQYQLMRQYKGVARLYGLLGAQSHIFISDPSALRQVLISKKELFTEGSIFISLNNLLFGKDAMTTKQGIEHRNQRRLMAPAFAKSSIESISPRIQQVTDMVVDKMNQTLNETNEIEIFELMSKTTLEITGFAVFNYSFGCFQGKENEFTKYAMGLFPTVNDLGPWILTLPLLVSLGLHEFCLKYISWGPVQKLAKIVGSFRRQSQDIFKIVAEPRFQNEEENEMSLISHILKANTAASEASGAEFLSDDEIISQICLILFAATETTSGTLVRVFEQLSIHQTVQAELRAAIKDAGNDALDDIPLLDAVIKETLRLHPPVPSMERVCLEDTIVTLSNPLGGLHNKQSTSIPILRGQTVIVGLAACNADPEIWGPDAMEWRPERWLKPLPERVIQAKIPGIVSHIMSFMGGDRSCIGQTFAMLELKIIVSTLLSNFEFSPVPGKEISWRLWMTQLPGVLGDKWGQFPIRVRKIK